MTTSERETFIVWLKNRIANNNKVYKALTCADAERYRSTLDELRSQNATTEEIIIELEAMSLNAETTLLTDTKAVRGTKMTRAVEVSSNIRPTFRLPIEGRPYWLTKGVPLLTAAEFFEQHHALMRSAWAVQDLGMLDRLCDLTTEYLAEGASAA